LEVDESKSVNLLLNDSVINKYTFHHLLGFTEQEFYYTYMGEEDMIVNFIVPHQYKQNIIELNAIIDNKKFELKSIPIRDIQLQIDQLKKNSSYENKLILENNILYLPNISKGSKIKIKLKRSIIIPEHELLYQYYLPKIIGVRTKEYTLTRKDRHHLEPQLVINHFNFSGNLLFDKIQINNDIRTSINQLKFQKNDYVNKDKTSSYNYLFHDINSGITSANIDGCQYNFGVIQPPKQNINNTPKEYIFVIDGSGSMRGKPIEMIKSSVNRILKQLNENDAFNILIYAADNIHFSSISLPVDENNILKASQFLSKEFGNGNLKLNQAFNRIDQLKLDVNYNRIITIFSDGDLDFNPNIYSSIKQHLQNSQLFILGIGNEINYQTFNYFELITGTKPIVIKDINYANTQLFEFENNILHPVLRNIKIFSKNYTLGEVFPHNFNGYLSQHSLNFITKNCTIRKEKHATIKGFNGKSIYQKDFELDSFNNDLGEALKFYWATEKINYLLREEQRCGDYCINNKKYQKEIEKIATDYNINSPYTFLSQAKYGIFNNDFDSDQDLIADWFDKCIYEKGTILTKGCPIQNLDFTGKDHFIQDASNEILRTVEFDLDKDIIRDEDFKKLNEIIDLLNKNKSLKFDLIGHTDARGDNAYNYDLALRRAKAVFEYFVKNGIIPNRLEIISLGDTKLKHIECKPAEKCEEWKNFENRRVELKIKKD